MGTRRVIEKVDPSARAFAQLVDTFLVAPELPSRIAAPKDLGPKTVFSKSLNNWRRVTCSIPDHHNLGNDCPAPEAIRQRDANPSFARVVKNPDNLCGCRIRSDPLLPLANSNSLLHVR
jgi:hypothetical protein